MPESLVADKEGCTRDRYGQYISSCMKSLQSVVDTHQTSEEMVATACQDLASTLKHFFAEGQVRRIGVAEQGQLHRATSSACIAKHAIQLAGVSSSSTCQRVTQAAPRRAQA